MPPGMTGANPFKNVGNVYEVEKMKEMEAEKKKNDPFAAYDRSKKGDPFAGFEAGGGSGEKAGADKAWQSERQKLAEWEKGGEIKEKPAAKLDHLAGFMGKDTGARMSGAAEAAAGIAERALEVRQEGGPFVVSNPVFDDHAASQFVCDACHKKVERKEFTDEQLMKLGDCIDERKEKSKLARLHWNKRTEEEDEGPWKGMMVRLHENGFGFVYTPELYARHDRDVYLHSRFVERFLGGARSVKDELEERGWVEGDWGKSRQNFARVQYLLDITPEGKLMAKDATKIELVCKQCERRRAMRKKAEEMNVAKAAAAVVASGMQAGPTLCRPVQKDFDPQAKLTSVLGSIRHKLGLPAPGTPNALPTPAIRGMAGQTSITMHSKMHGGSAVPDLLKKADGAGAHSEMKGTAAPRKALEERKTSGGLGSLPASYHTARVPPSTPAQTLQSPAPPPPPVPRPPAFGRGGGFAPAGRGTGFKVAGGPITEV